ncbi:ligase-associated DNA damage response endonuclease PdeM [Ramlibacter sp.]|uniref:ligase-associated DNA damage response endonuclease PdeM n=1 Tax=Ramlibacter sp. TaxID=1917967 RepID=UPI0035B08F40
MQIDLAGTRAELHACGALHLPEWHTVLVADAHFGKAVSFRRLGVPVPRGTTLDTVSRLDAVLAATGARRVVFLGDFLHSARSHATGTQAALATWRAGHRDLALTLVRGNHDDRAGDPPAALGIEVVDEPLPLGPFALCHHPAPVEGAYVLAGHWHPCVHLMGRGHERLRLPCFWLREGAVAVGVLPAFGAFTGMHPIDRRPGDRVYAIAGDQVRAVPAG